MPSQQITSTSILRVLLLGFALVILLLLAAAFVGVESTRSIQENAARLVEEQLVTTRLIDEIQREEGTLTAVFHNLGQEPESVDREKILAQLDESNRHIERVVAAAAGTPEEPLWQELERASAAFTNEARRMRASGELFHRHDEVIAGDLLEEQETSAAEIAQKAGLEARTSRLLLDALGVLAK